LQQRETNILFIFAAMTIQAAFRLDDICRVPDKASCRTGQALERCCASYPLARSSLCQEWLLIDPHCHEGIDDGASNLDSAWVTAGVAASHEVGDNVSTPHISLLSGPSSRLFGDVRAS
jgi:hypothetical protein